MTMASKTKCDISKKKVQKVLDLLRLLTSLNKTNQETALRFLTDEGVDFISETIFNVLYNPHCTSTLTKKEKSKLVKHLKPKSKILQKISNKKHSVLYKRKQISQSGSGISLLLSAAIPFLISLLTPKK